MKKICINSSCEAGNPATVEDAICDFLYGLFHHSNTNVDEKINGGREYICIEFFIEDELFYKKQNILNEVYFLSLVSFIEMNIRRLVYPTRLKVWVEGE